MVLSDRDIRRSLCAGDLVIDPLDDDRIQPASVDLTLCDEFLVRPWSGAYECHPIDLDDVEGSLATQPMRKKKCKLHILLPREFCLGSTLEHIEIPNDMVGRVEGKSSLGRLGLIVHATAGYVDPGFKGKITLEIYNLNFRPIILHPGKSICQLSFSRLESPAVYPYGHEKVGSHYQGQNTVTGSRYTG